MSILHICTSSTLLVLVLVTRKSRDASTKYRERSQNVTLVPGRPSRAPPPGMSTRVIPGFWALNFEQSCMWLAKVGIDDPIGNLVYVFSYFLQQMLFFDRFNRSIKIEKNIQLCAAIAAKR